MNHLENLRKLRDTLKEKLAETNDMADYEGKYGSASTSERLKDECKMLNDSIDSLEWVIEKVKPKELKPAPSHEKPL